MKGPKLSDTLEPLGKRKNRRTVAEEAFLVALVIGIAIGFVFGFMLAIGLK